MAPTSAGRPPERGIDTVSSSFGWFLVLFFVPSLPVRYGLGLGAAPLSAAAAAFLLAVACWYGAREALARAPGNLAAWAAQLAITLAAGLAGAAAARLLPARYAESRLLWAAAAFFLCALPVCALLGRVLPAARAPADR